MNRTIIKIIVALREKEKLTIKEIVFLVEDVISSKNGLIPGHTGAAIFGNLIYLLAKYHFVEIEDDGKQIRDIILKECERKDYYDNGYTLSKYLRFKEERITLSLTDKIYEIQSLLGISFTDLLKIHKDHLNIKPIFGPPNKTHSSNVFVIMPFTKELEPVYNTHIKNVCENRLKVACKRADDIFESSNIMSDIWSSIYNAGCIIADCTGKNPNVFYELGIAHTLGKRVIIITQSRDDIPFDIRHLRHIKYELTKSGMMKFEQELRDYLYFNR